jgi:enoyl-[acyl-carrier-protein] reductase (NADH)
VKQAVRSQAIPEAAVFLASDEAGSVIGRTIMIDGSSLTRGYPALLTGPQAAQR